MSCLRPIAIQLEGREGDIRFVTVPCGKCANCLKRKQSEWLFRLEIEQKLCFSSFFITLTYSDAHLPLKGVQKLDCQNFLKRYRKLYTDDDNKIKYFLVSEYGSQTSRPHYHLILFHNTYIDIREECNRVYSCWKKGEIKIGSVDIASLSYVTKYCLKPSFDKNGFFREKTFALMSRRPAIGLDYLYNGEVVRLHQECAKYKVVTNDGYLVNLPRYYRERLFDAFDNYLRNQELLKEFEEYQKKIDAIPFEDRYIMWESAERKLKQKNKKSDKL